ncbi:hypothetical protein HDU67_009099, partial [Dinochytrium kinnereticum]
MLNVPLDANVYLKTYMSLMQMQLPAIDYTSLFLPQMAIGNTTQLPYPIPSPAQFLEQLFSLPPTAMSSASPALFYPPPSASSTPELKAEQLPSPPESPNFILESTEKPL